MCSIKKIDKTNKKACELIASDINKLNIDIFIIVETFLKSSIPDSYVTIDGFNLYRRDRKICNCRKAECSNLHKGGGVLIYVRKSFSCDVYGCSENAESLWLEIKHPSTMCTVFVNGSYNPPRSDGSVLLNYISCTSSKILKNNPKTVIFVGGDFNHLDTEDLSLDHGLQLLRSPPTRGSATLDLILTNRPDLTQTTECFCPTIETDHCGVIVHPKTRTPPTRRTINFLDTSFKYRARLNSNLQNHDFSYLYSISDVNTAAEWLDSEICGVVQASFPTRTVKISDRDPIWMTPKIKWLLCQKKRALKKGKMLKISKLDDVIKSSKIWSLTRRGSQNWWQLVDQVTHRKSMRNIPENFEDPVELNKQLASRCALLDGETRGSVPEFELDNRLVPQLNIREVADILQHCKNTSPGPTKIPIFVFREFWDILAPLYLHVWNYSIKKAIFPASYKKANVIPLPKKDHVTSVDDIRGISITPITARLFEKVVHKRWITPNIEQVGDKLQFAYKRKMSTIDNLLTFQHHILSSLDEKKTDGVHAILIDYTKAFDRLNQEKAAHSYPTFIEHPHLCQWLYSFSTDRQQRLLWNNQPQEYEKIERGCSQGTVGGPGIFSMYTDCIRPLTTEADLFKYSDDMSLITPCKCHPNEKESSILSTEFQHLQASAINLGLQINEKKTKHLRFCLNRVPCCKCDNVSLPIETVNKANILGITFQQDLKFTHHTTKLLANLKRQLYVLRDLKHAHASTSDIDTVFQAIIISRIRYGLPVYGSDKYSLTRIDEFLKRCFDKGWSSKRHNIYELLAAEDQRMVESILSRPNHPLHEYLTRSEKPRKTRHCFSYTMPIVRTTAFSNSFCNRILPL